MDSENNKISTRKGLIAISPMLFFVLFYLISSLCAGDFNKVPLPIAFLLASVYGVMITRNKSLPDRVRTFGRGAGTTKVLFIIWLFFLAGIFSNVANLTGCFQETVNITLKFCPPNAIFAGLFIAACVVSMATGTAIGTVLTLAPIGVGLANAIGSDLAFTTAIVVGGAFFGDNLSFISDTTIVATSTQECQMVDKFKVNIRIVLPVAILILIYYIYKGSDLDTTTIAQDVNYLKALPYAAVIILALCNIDVMIVLTVGIVISAIIGLADGAFDFYGLLAAMCDGLYSMKEVCIVTLLAAGLMELIKENGGLDFLLRAMTKIIRGKRSAEFGIALLVVVAGACTAVNTIAILSVSGIAKELSAKYGLDNRKVASILDTFACAIQGLIPYGAHLLVGASLAGITSLALMPYLYYPMLIGVAATIAIILRLPRKYS